MKSVLVYHYPVGKPPEARWLLNTLEGMQKAVGGYVEYVRLGRQGYMVVCNEEGLLLNMKPNRQTFRGIVIHGDFFVTKVDDADDSGDLLSLSEKEFSEIDKKMIGPPIFESGT